MENTLIHERPKYPTSAKELRMLYGVSHKTWSKYLKRCGFLIPKGTKIYLPEEVTRIVDRLGPP